MKLGEVRPTTELPYEPIKRELRAELLKAIGNGPPAAKDRDRIFGLAAELAGRRRGTRGEHRTLKYAGGFADGITATGDMQAVEFEKAARYGPENCGADVERGYANGHIARRMLEGGFSMRLDDGTAR